MYVRSFFILLMAGLAVPAIAMETGTPPHTAPPPDGHPHYDQALKAYFRDHLNRLRNTTSSSGKKTESSLPHQKNKK